MWSREITSASGSLKDWMISGRFARTYIRNKLDMKSVDGGDIFCCNLLTSLDKESSCSLILWFISIGQFLPIAENVEPIMRNKKLSSLKVIESCTDLDAKKDPSILYTKFASKEHEVILALYRICL